MLHLLLRSRRTTDNNTLNASPFAEEQARRKQQLHDLQGLFLQLRHKLCRKSEGRSGERVDEVNSFSRAPASSQLCPQQYSSRHSGSNNRAGSSRNPIQPFLPIATNSSSSVPAPQQQHKHQGKLTLHHSSTSSSSAAAVCSACSSMNVLQHVHPVG